VRFPWQLRRPYLQTIPDPSGGENWDVPRSDGVHGTSVQGEIHAASLHDRLPKINYLADGSPRPASGRRCRPLPPCCSAHPPHRQALAGTGRRDLGHQLPLRLEVSPYKRSSVTMTLKSALMGPCCPTLALANSTCTAPPVTRAWKITAGINGVRNVTLTTQLLSGGGAMSPRSYTPVAGCENVVKPRWVMNPGLTDRPSTRAAAMVEDPDPAGPVGPVDPAGPVDPDDPAGPVDPDDPDPAGPVGPCLPRSPCSPRSPRSRRSWLRGVIEALVSDIRKFL
jgi:hypothetical protein